MKRYCDVCETERDESQCPECLEPTRLLEAEPSSRESDERASASPVTNTTDPRRTGPDESAARREPMRPSPPPPPSEPIPAAEPSPPPSPSSDARDATTIPKARQSELEEYIEEGYEVYLIAGVQGTGKTQLLGSYQQDAFLRQVRKDPDGHALPTRPNQLDCVTIPIPGRKIVFVDASGENFRQLHPLQRFGGVVPEGHVDFLRLVSQRLAGVVLLISLDDLWAETAAARLGHREQIEILTWVLMLLRWLQEDGVYPAGEITFQQHVNRQVQRLRKRLDVPVLTLFSRADELPGLVVPRPSGPGWLHRQVAERRLEPVGEDPLLLAHHRLPTLLNALTTHVNHFRVDFAHSLAEDPDTGALVEDGGCGLSSLDWMLDGTWRSRLPGIPTRWWLALDRRLNTKRWRHLPDPRPLA